MDRNLHVVPLRTEIVCLLSDLRHLWTEYFSQLVTVIRQDDRGTVVGFRAGTKDFFLLQSVQTGDHSAF